MVIMKPFPFLVVLSVSLVAAQEKSQVTSTKKVDNAAAKRYLEQEPLFRPPAPPLPIQRRISVDSGAEQIPSFFQSEHNKQQQQLQQNKQTEPKIESRQFDFQQHPEPISQFAPQNDFNNFQQQPQDQQQFAPRQQQGFDPNQFQQFNQPQQQQQQQQQQQPQQNFQFPQEQPQQGQQQFQDVNNFQSRQQENLPTLPPVFIPPNQPIGPPPALQSPIRNLFREPEPPFSLAGLFQRFLRLFNINN